MRIRFTNPRNGYTETATTGFTWLWCLLFGFMYFAYKGVWRHAVVALLLAFATAGFSWWIYPFFAGNIVRSHYLRQGWVQAPR